MHQATPMGQLEEILQFEEEERDRYLALFFPWEEAKEYFPNLPQQQYQQLIIDTKMGISHGVQEYLKAVNPSSPPSSIYLIDVRKFYLHNDLTRFIRAELNGKYSGYSDDYCREVGNGYGSFLYNYSLSEFRKDFSTSLPRRAHG